MLVGLTRAFWERVGNAFISKEQGMEDHIWRKIVDVLLSVDDATKQNVYSGSHLMLSLFMRPNSPTCFFLARQQF